MDMHTNVSSMQIESIVEANDAILRIKECESEVDIKAVLRPLIRYFGAESFVFVSMRHDDARRESYQYFIGCLPAWCQLYNRRRWYAIDPFVKYALSHSTPILGSAIVAESPGQAEMLAAAAQNGFRSGMVIPSHGGSRSRVGVLYVGSPLPPEDVEPHLLQHRVMLRAVSLELLEWWQAKLKANDVRHVKLSSYDLNLLALQRDGYTSEESAQELGLTTSQVNNRYRRINARLCVANKAMAVERAVELGLLAA